MQWTDEQQAEFLTQFYQDVIEPAARRLAEGGAEMLTIGTDSNQESYFSRREDSSMKPGDLELDLENIDWVREAISDITHGPEGEILADVYRKILDLADRFEEVEGAEDVSPYIYVMF